LADVTAWLRGRGVATFKQPERIAILDALPRNAMNKVMRAELRRLVLETASTMDSAP
jgi:non-ribosomal peptide synthetase component E (peptide arylation enzyme)